MVNLVKEFGLGRRSWPIFYASDNRRFETVLSEEITNSFRLKVRVIDTVLMLDSWENNGCWTLQRLLVTKFSD